MLTSGGHGIAILWPFSSTRFFFDWRPIQVSPLATSRFLARATTIGLSELRWIWAPAIVVAVALRAIRPLKGMQA
jgi:inner membrane protein